MERILDIYIDYETETTRHFIEKCRELTHEQLHQTFDVGHGTLYDTIVHIIDNTGGWTQLMREVPMQRPSESDEGMGESGEGEAGVAGGEVNEVDGLLESYDAVMAYFTGFARAVVADNRLDDTFEDHRWGDPVTTRLDRAILHVLTHNTGHHGEMQHMLQRLGVEKMRDGDLMEWGFITDDAEAERANSLK
ncbi:MAG: DinB family protein [Chloroflexia bacterium]